MGKRITKSIDSKSPKWAFENSKTIKLNEKQSRILTRGSGQRFFTMPISMIRHVQKALQNEDVWLNESQVKKCVWVMDLKALQTPKGENFKIEVKNIY